MQGVIIGGSLCGKSGQQKLKSRHRKGDILFQEVPLPWFDGDAAAVTVSHLAGMWEGLVAWNSHFPPSFINLLQPI